MDPRSHVFASRGMQNQILIRVPMGTTPPSVIAGASFKKAVPPIQQLLLALTNRKNAFPCGSFLELFKMPSPSPDVLTSDIFGSMLYVYCKVPTRKPERIGKKSPREWLKCTVVHTSPLLLPLQAMFIKASSSNETTPICRKQQHWSSDLPKPPKLAGRSILAQCNVSPTQ